MYVIGFSVWSWVLARTSAVQAPRPAAASRRQEFRARPERHGTSCRVHSRVKMLLMVITVRRMYGQFIAVGLA
jgi:hypothetical protein